MDYGFYSYASLLEDNLLENDFVWRCIWPALVISWWVKEMWHPAGRDIGSSGGSVWICHLDKTMTANHYGLPKSLRIDYPLVNIQKAIENGHRNSGFSHEKWWFSIAMLVHQRVVPTCIYKAWADWGVIDFDPCMCLSVNWVPLNPLVNHNYNFPY